MVVGVEAEAGAGAEEEEVQSYNNVPTCLIMLRQLELFLFNESETLDHVQWSAHHIGCIYLYWVVDDDVSNEDQWQFVRVYLDLV